jgi:hypothetical protein
MTLLATALLLRLHHWAGNRIGDAQPATEIFKGVAERAERPGHSVTCANNRAMALSLALAFIARDIDLRGIKRVRDASGVQFIGHLNARTKILRDLFAIHMSAVSKVKVNIVVRSEYATRSCPSHSHRKRNAAPRDLREYGSGSALVSEGA